MLGLLGLSTGARASGAITRAGGAVLPTKSDDVICSIQRANGSAGLRLRSRGERQYTPCSCFSPLRWLIFFVEHRGGSASCSGTMSQRFFCLLINLPMIVEAVRTSHGMIYACATACTRTAEVCNTVGVVDAVWYYGGP